MTLSKEQLDLILNALDNLGSFMQTVQAQRLTPGDAALWAKIKGEEIKGIKKTLLEAK